MFRWIIGVTCHNHLWHEDIRNRYGVETGHGKIARKATEWKCNSRVRARRVWISKWMGSDKKTGRDNDSLIRLMLIWNILDYFPTSPWSRKMAISTFFRYSYIFFCGYQRAVYLVSVVWFQLELGNRKGSLRTSCFLSSEQGLLLCGRFLGCWNFLARNGYRFVKIWNCQNSALSSSVMSVRCDILCSRSWYRNKHLYDSTNLFFSSSHQGFIHLSKILPSYSMS